MLEGLDLISDVLDENGYIQLKLKKKDGKWSLDVPMVGEEFERFLSLKRYVVFSGEQTADERDLLVKIFRGDLDKLPVELQEQIGRLGEDNLNGEIAKLIMITQAGAEGLDLRAVRHVHV